ncbi:tRNA (N(6)-L-threonylcarbamoyladenosine(37)-C(2))-methylthiotransferase MtaB, partial [bacterium]|nr:tRNA (N(6)-L-threonylcarbamoyladenosine(37)-C(2))-methylthiotransferase MtaB [bacterium]
MDSPRRTTVGIMTVGCKLNQYESEGMTELFESRGCEIVPFTSPADIYVVNTCTVTARSDYRCRQMLRRAARLATGALVVAAGCYAQRDAEALAEMPEVGLVVGNSHKMRLAELALAELRARHRRASVDETPTEDTKTSEADESSHRTAIHRRSITETAFQALDVRRFRGYTRAFLKIQDGCDARCAYCAVPDARGPSRSRPYNDVLKQARLLAAAGYRELVLTGV